MTIHIDSETNAEFLSLSLDDQVALVPSNKEEAIQSWEKLWSDLKDLQELTTEFGRIVAEQQDRIDGVNENIEQAEQRIEQGGGELRKVSPHTNMCAPCTEYTSKGSQNCAAVCPTTV